LSSRKGTQGQTWTLVQDSVDCTVVELDAVVDDDETLAGAFDVLHVVRGEQYRDSSFPIQAADELPDALFDDHIQPDGRFIEEHELWRVKQRRRDVCSHALAEGQLPYGLMDERG